jgi:hypothetical protein
MQKFLITAVLLSFVSGCPTPQTPENAFNEFLTHETKESYLVQPLCNAGEKVVPLVIEKIKDKDLQRRRYAIGFLGSGNYRQALPVLEKILGDESEQDLFRGDALKSIYLIDLNLGKSLSGKYREREDFLGRIAGELLQGRAGTKREEICNPTD